MPRPRVVDDRAFVHGLTLPTPFVRLPVSAAFPGVMRQARGTDLTIQWPPKYGQHAYVSVFRANPSNPRQPDLVLDTPPRISFADIFAFAYRTPTSMTIPGSAFMRDGAYAVFLVTMKRTEGSYPFLAGSGAALILAVGDFSP